MTPSVCGFARRGDRIISVFGIALLYFRQDQVGIHRRTIFKFFLGFDILAVDEHAIFLAQILFERLHGFVEASVQLFGRIEHG